MPSALRTIEQERASYAWNCVSKVKDQRSAGDYRSLAVKVPSLVLNNGLGQTLAFLKAKGEKDEHRLLYQHIDEWLKRQIGACNDTLEWIVNKATSGQYRLATAEALALLRWFRRFAEATLSKERESQ